MIADGRGIPCRLERQPRRIVSLVPSTTETLHALGLAELVVGVTRFCVRPQPWVKSIAKVGGTKDPDPAKILALRPDLIIGNCEENTREVFAAVEGHCPLWAAFPKDVDGALADLTQMGTLLGVAERARQLTERITQARQTCVNIRERTGPFRYAWLIWRDPWMTVSDDTFVASMMEQIGGTNVFSGEPDRFPVFEPTQLGAHNPDVVLLSSEPFPFRDRHVAELAAATGLDANRFRFVDGEFGTWHGARMEPAFEAFATYRIQGWPDRPIGRPSTRP